MRLLLKNIYYSFPIQLLLLHFRKYQILLVIWAILASTINSGLLKNFGADSLFFVPEYMGKVNYLSTGLVGITMGVFFMSWNITTFILHTKRFKFLATTSKPFLKYCINNSVLPLLFLLFYIFKAVHFNLNKELMGVFDVAFLVIGFSAGLISVSKKGKGYHVCAEDSDYIKCHEDQEVYDWVLEKLAEFLAARQIP